MDEWLINTAETHARWVAVLSNGEEYHQDDGRPNAVGNAWNRLVDHCRNNHLHLVDIYLKFRSHVERKAEYRNADGYWFRFGITASVKANKKGKNSYNSILIGIMRDGKMHVDNWRVPELLLVESDTREIPKNDETIIWKEQRYPRRGNSEDNSETLR